MERSPRTSKLSARLQKEYSDLQKHFGKVSSADGTWACEWTGAKNIRYTLLFHIGKDFPHTEPTVEVGAGVYSKSQRLRLVNFLPASSLLFIACEVQNRLKNVPRPEVALQYLNTTIDLHEEVASKVRSSQSPVFPKQQQRPSSAKSPILEQRTTQKALKIVLSDERLILINELHGQVQLRPIGRSELSPGIANLGNSCFANTVLQLLFHRKLLRYLVFVEPTSSNPRLNALIKLFRSLQTDKQAFTNKQIINDIEADFRTGWEQRDAYDFLLSLLDTLVTSCAFKDAMRSLFEVGYLETVQCRKCRKNEDTARSCLVVNINGIERYRSVQQALTSQGSGQCLCGGPITVKSSYTTEPRYLLIHPNWNEPSRGYSSQCDLSPRLKIGKKNYSLKGIAQHYGTSRFGHYTYYHNAGKEGVQYNDSIVSPAYRPTGRAIILVYESDDDEHAFMMRMSQSQIRQTISRLQVVKDTLNSQHYKKVSQENYNLKLAKSYNFDGASQKIVAVNYDQNQYFGLSMGTATGSKKVSMVRPMSSQPRHVPTSTYKSDYRGYRYYH